MEINEKVKSFLSEAGILTAFQNVVSNAENEEFDEKAEAQTFKSTQEKLFENKHKERIVSKEDLDKQFNTVRGTLSQTANKYFELGLPRKEAENMKLEEILAKAKTKFDQEKEGLKNETNEEMIEKIKNLQKVNATLSEEKESLIEAKEQEIAEKEKEYNMQIRQRDVRDIYTKEYGKYDWGIENKALIPVIKNAVEKQISDKFIVNSDGTLSGKDATHAESFDGNGIYTNVEEPIAYLLKEQYKVVQLSNDSGGGGQAPVNGATVTDANGEQKVQKLTDGAQDMKARILEKMQKQNGGRI